MPNLGHICFLHLSHIQRSSTQPQYRHVHICLLTLTVDCGTQIERKSGQNGMVSLHSFGLFMTSLFRAYECAIYDILRLITTN